MGAGAWEWWFSGRRPKRLGFLTVGLFDEVEPGRVREDTLPMLELAERLGFDGAWLRAGAAPTPRRG